MVDIHCHILPIDDGAKNYDESLHMLKDAAGEGITDIVATPHFDAGSDSVQEFLDIRDRAADHLREEILKQDMIIKIHCSAEILVDPKIVNLPLDRFAIGGKYILVEFPYGGYLFWLREVLYEIGLMGYIPIIAHPERYEDLFRDSKFFEEVSGSGALFQVCAASVTDKSIKRRIERLITNGKVSALASDMHYKRGAGFGFSRAYRYLEDRYGEIFAAEIKENSSRILSGEPIVCTSPTYKNIFTRTMGAFEWFGRK